MPFTLISIKFQRGSELTILYPCRTVHKFPVLTIFRGIHRYVTLTLIKEPHSSNGFQIKFSIANAGKHQTQCN